MKQTSKLDTVGGKFVGITLKDGKSYNAQILGSTPKFVSFRNTRNGDMIKKSKDSIASLSYGGKTFR